MSEPEPYWGATPRTGGAVGARSRAAPRGAGGAAADEQRSDRRCSDRHRGDGSDPGCSVRCSGAPRSAREAGRPGLPAARQRPGRRPRPRDPRDDRGARRGHPALRPDLAGQLPLDRARQLLDALRRARGDLDRPGDRAPADPGAGRAAAAARLPAGPRHRDLPHRPGARDDGHRGRGGPHLLRGRVHRGAARDPAAPLPPAPARAADRVARSGAGHSLRDALARLLRPWRRSRADRQLPPGRR